LLVFIGLSVSASAMKDSYRTVANLEALYQYHSWWVGLRRALMISRREFLATSAVGALAMATSRFPTAEAEAPNRLGVQLYVLRDLLAKDFDGTLAKVAGMGIKTVEFSGFYDRTAPEVRTSLSNAGLTASGAH
jgi:hypothetical protein